MAAIKVACPSCQSHLKSARPLPPGLKVKCPKCGTPFTVPGASGQSANGNGAAAAPAAPPPPPASPQASPPGPQPLAPPGEPRGNALAALGAVGGLLLFLALGGGLLWYCFSGEGGQPAPPPVAGPPEGSPEVTAPIVPAVKPLPKPLITLPPEKQARVDAATQRGVAYLKKIQHPNGSWDAVGHEGADPLGQTSLACLTMIECAVPKDDPALQKGAKFVREHCPKMVGTYQTALAVLFLDHLGDPADEERIRELGLRLAFSQSPEGGWGYHLRVLAKNDEEAFRKVLEGLGKEKPEELLKKPGAVPDSLRGLAVLQKQEGRPPNFYRGGGDNSNTQFALLAVLAAKRHNLPLDPCLALIAKRFRSTQNGDGSWNYTNHHNAVPWPTMTCCGLLGVAIDYGLAKDVRKIVRPEQDPQVQKALEHLSKNIGEPIANPKAPVPMFRMYYLWCVERVGVLYRLKEIKGKAWYDWGMDFVLQNQREDGGWSADNPGWATASTCFALLFLQRADLAEDLTAKLRDLADIPVWRDETPEGETPAPGS